MQKNKTIMTKILVAEDDISIAKTIEYNLVKNGYEVHLVRDGDEVLEYAKIILPEMIIVDWVLPGLQGPIICSLLRSDPATVNIPIMMISSKNAETDKVNGLEHGADDYITKPIAPVELIARIKAILRRVRSSLVSKKLHYANLEIDLQTCTVRTDKAEIMLSPIEYQILQLLVEYPRKVFTREELIDRIWKDNSNVNSRTIDVHITRLRKQLNNAGINAIKTVRTIGYKLEIA